MSEWIDPNQPPEEPRVPAPMQVKPKSPGAAAVLSLVLPGAGQLLNGDVALGVVMIIMSALAWLSMLVLIGFIAVPAVYLWSIIEAYSSAKKWNESHGIIS